MIRISNQYHVATALPGGERAYVRAIRPQDRDVIRAEFARLSPESVRNRFMIAKRELSERELTHLTEVDFVNHVALMADIEAGEALRTSGVGRFVRDAERADHAEFAITVAEDCQGKGIGRLLFDHLVLCARDLGIANLDGTLFAENRRMLKLLHRTGLPMELHSDAGIDSVSLRIQG